MMHTLGLEFDSRHALCIWTILYFSQLLFHVVAHKPGPSSWKVYRSQPVNDKTDKKPIREGPKRIEKKKTSSVKRYLKHAKSTLAQFLSAEFGKARQMRQETPLPGRDAAFNIIANYCRDATQAQRWRMSHSRLTTMLLLAFWPCRSGGRTLSHTHTATLSVSFPFSSLRWRRFNVFLSLKHTHTQHLVCLFIHIFKPACMLLCDNVAPEAWLYRPVKRDFLLNIHATHKLVYTHVNVTTKHT